MNSLQNLMRTGEAALGASLLGPGTCVFADGPLNYFTSATDALVGVIKRIFLPYLDAGHFALVGQLAPGERTPLFSIRDGKYDRYSWFQRLAMPRAMEHSLAGIIRLEVRAALGCNRQVRSRASLQSDCLTLRRPLYAIHVHHRISCRWGRSKSSFGIVWETQSRFVAQSKRESMKG